MQQNPRARSLPNQRVPLVRTLPCLLSALHTGRQAGRAPHPAHRLHAAAVAAAIIDSSHTSCDSNPSSTNPYCPKTPTTPWSRGGSRSAACSSGQHAALWQAVASAVAERTASPAVAPRTKNHLSTEPQVRAVVVASIRRGNRQAALQHREPAAADQGVPHAGSNTLSGCRTSSSSSAECKESLRELSTRSHGYRHKPVSPTIVQGITPQMHLCAAAQPSTPHLGGLQSPHTRTHTQLGRQQTTVAINTTPGVRASPQRPKAFVQRQA